MSHISAFIHCGKKKNVFMLHFPQLLKIIFKILTAETKDTTKTLRGLEIKIISRLLEHSIRPFFFF